MGTPLQTIFSISNEPIFPTGFSLSSDKYTASISSATKSAGKSRTSAQRSSVEPKSISPPPLSVHPISTASPKDYSSNDDGDDVSSIIKASSTNAQSELPKGDPIEGAGKEIVVFENPSQKKLQVEFDKEQAKREKLNSQLKIHLRKKKKL
ncbi:hypothetical protein L1987_20891 [Smallanthus sonchifolius]|uniref:Uncharacterized protein n=1 Tax=Smallanthus sonchifolius TaxID=185202 RepID=A0ACB9IUJ3_9ASTR|nr:hypothetical protein L1987_20891 [Smallanthus sonchifolius]